MLGFAFSLEPVVLARIQCAIKALSYKTKEVKKKRRRKKQVSVLLLTHLKGVNTFHSERSEQCPCCKLQVFMNVQFKPG